MKSARNVIKEVVEQMNVRFMVCPQSEASTELAMLSYDKSQVKYPLIILDPIFDEKCGQENGVESEFNATFYFCVDSEENYTNQQREDINYVGRLYPIVETFFYFIFRSGKFVFDMNPQMCNERFLPHERANLYKAPNQLNEIIDVLKLTINLKIRK